jgi:hypothetical protein
LSVKFTAIGLDGKARKLTRARAERLVEGGSHEWQGARTIREKKAAASVSPVQNCIRVRFEPQFFFDHDYPGPGAGPQPGDHPLPYTYPLPYDILRHYQSGLLPVMGHA